MPYSNTRYSPAKVSQSPTERIPGIESPNVEPIRIRPATFLDATAMGNIAAKTYLHTPLSSFVAPHRFQYPQHFARSFIQNYRKRILDHRNISFVVCTKLPESKKEVVVGFAQFIRLGEDACTKAQIVSWSCGTNFVSVVLGWCYGLFCVLLEYFVGGDKSANKENRAKFLSWGQRETSQHWNNVQERRERWHVQSLIIRPEFQRRGIGKMLMREVLDRAERENVVVGLESSGMGVGMYKSVGFEVLEWLKGDASFEERAGAVMLWTPPTWKVRDSISM